MDNQNYPQLLQKILTDQQVRQEITFKNHQWFFNVYFPHFVTYKSAPFHDEFFGITEDDGTKISGITAFRGSSKSTIFTLSYPLWAIMGRPEKKLVVILCQTEQQAKNHLLNIKRELEANELLRKDMGPFREEEDEWRSVSLVIPKYGAKVMAVSIDQSIRGLRFRQYRPDLIIADDIDDLTSVRTKELRDKTFNTVTSEIIPLGDRKTKMIFLGNLLHEDCFLMRLKKQILANPSLGKFMEVPLLSGSEEDQIAWTGKYPTMEDIEKERMVTTNEIAWQREYLLKIVAEEDRIISPEHIGKYSDLPPQDKEHDFRGLLISIDPAVSLKEDADYTGIVVASLYGYGTNYKVYIQEVINARLLSHQIIERVQAICRSSGKDKPVVTYVENVQSQAYLAQLLNDAGVKAEAVGVHGNDKRMRLFSVSSMIQNKTVLFPEKGAELLISQLLGFGAERYDDLLDATTQLLIKVVGMDHKKHDMGVMDCDSTGLITRMNGKDVPPPKKYFYLGQEHTESKEDYYRRIQGYKDKGLL